MSTNFCSIVTQAGLTKQLQCLSNSTNLEVAYIAVGDGNGTTYTPTEEQTSLKNEKWRGAILSHGIENNNFYATASIPINIGGFTIREIGLFDVNNILLCVGKCPETNKHISTEGGSQELFVKMYMTICNSDLVPLIVQHSTEMASFEYVQNNFATRDLNNLTSAGQSKFDKKQNKLKAGKGIAIVDDTIINTGALFEELETITINIPSVNIIEGTVYEVID